jgi:hypothetical protein
MEIASPAPPRAGRWPTPVRVACAGLVALALGILTAYAQGWLPSEIGSLANTAGSWSLVAFALACLATDGRVAALIGGLVLVGLLVGYLIGEHARGYASGSSLIAFWGLAAVLAGPLLGIAGFWAGRGQGLRPGVGAGLMSGILVGEGVYGLTYISGTTYRPYWWLEAAVGIGLAAFVVGRRPSRARNGLVAFAVGAVTASAFVAVYSADLIGVLP